MNSYDVVLTAYLDAGGDLQFHGGRTAGDLRRDMTRSEVDLSGLTILRRFYIKGKIVREDGLPEPIRVCPAMRS